MASNTGLLARTRNLVSRKDHNHGNEIAAAAAPARGGFAAEAGGGGRFRPVMTNSKVKTYPVVKHYQGLPTSHVIRFKGGKRVASGPALSFWFRELNTSIVEVPKDDQELHVVFQGRSSDFQEITVQGIVTYRVVNPEVAAARIDFSIDVETGNWRVDPKVKIESLLTQIAQARSIAFLSAESLETLLEGNTLAQLTFSVEDAYTTDPSVSGTGLEIVSVTLSSIKPRADVENALKVPTFERLQEQADQATFSRRASAVEKERTIQQNELATQLELSKRKESLLEQERVNTLKQTQTRAETERIGAESSAARTRIIAEAEAESARLLGEVENAAERERMEIVGSMDPQVLLAVALQKLAENPPPNLRTVVLGDSDIMSVRSNADQD